MWARCDLLWSSHSAPSVHFHSVSSTPRHVARSFTPALVCARILAVVEDSLDSADGLGVEFTLDSFRRVVASIHHQAETQPNCTDVIVVKAIHPRP